MLSIVSNNIMSIIFGILIAFIIYYKYFYYIIRGPSSDVIRNQIYKYDNKCYKFVPEIRICPMFSKHI